MKAKTILSVMMAAPLLASADAVRVYDVDDYVQRGLITHFDGIRNAGEDEPHSFTTNIWTNLVSGKPDAEFVGETGSWADSGLGYYFNGTRSAYAMISSPGIALGNYATIQLALDATPLENGAKYTGFFRSLGDIEDYLTFWSGTDGATIVLKDDAYSQESGKHRPSLSGWEGQYVTVMLDDANSYIFQGAQPENALARTSIIAVPEAAYSFGGSNADNRWFKGVYHSVRIYNVALSTDELQQNHIGDEARFRNEATKGKGNDDVNVVVASNVDGVEGAEECGKWYIPEGTHVFTAPASVMVGKKGYVLAGYTVEEWNGSAWGAAVTNSGASYEASSSEKVRLTWLWTEALRGTYDVDDYVQDNLFLHFDGIRNAGAADGHATEGTTWKNLVAGQPNATITTGDGSDIVGYWESNGFHLNPVDRTDLQEYVYLNSDVDIGKTFAIQLVTDIDLSKQSVAKSGIERYPSYFNTYDGSNATGMWTNNKSSTSDTLVGAFDSYVSGNRIDLASWEGKYVTMMLSEDAGQAWFFQTAGDTLPAGETCTVTTSPGSKQYTWGGAMNASDTYKKIPVRGVYHAVRIYTNTLDAAQIQHNRKIDDLRFRGIGDITVVNGVVGETGTVGASSVPDGVYNLESDSWTFTASNMKVDGKTYRPHLSVETWSGDAWVKSSKAWTGKYTLSRPLAARVRLTWTWGIPQGLIISVH